MRPDRPDSVIESPSVSDGEVTLTWDAPFCQGSSRIQQVLDVAPEMSVSVLSVSTRIHW